MIEDAATGQVIARFPHALEHIITHPSSRQWAGSAGNHVYLIALEGVDRDEPPGLSGMAPAADSTPETIVRECGRINGPL